MMHEKYDLKGSTYKRLASKHERAKASPTLKDLDFISEHPDGLLLDVGVYDAIMKTISRDCLVLESFKIMDYSLLVGIHNKNSAKNAADVTDGGEPSTSNQKTKGKTVRVKSEKMLDSDYYKTYEQISFPARNQRGDDLLLFLELQVTEKLEHTWKSMLHDGDTISVHNPTFYAQRFITFLKSHVFHITAAELVPKGSHTKFKSVVTSYLALRHSPSKRYLPRRSLTEKDEAETVTLVDISRRPFSNPQKPREKKIERLFAPDPDPTELLKTNKSHSSEENVVFEVKKCKGMSYDCKGGL
ncbi:Phosphatidylinositol 4-phosphate 5-kinase type-1 beta [Dirofilaria immitis]|nr:Phosphatidylinositol 4-phosphate 5-kinase type-1 beta [Dirofilaria immitis]